MLRWSEVGGGRWEVDYYVSSALKLGDDGGLSLVLVGYYDVGLARNRPSTCPVRRCPKEYLFREQKACAGRVAIAWSTGQEVYESPATNGDGMLSADVALEDELSAGVVECVYTQR